MADLAPTLVPTLEVAGLRKSYGVTVALDGVDLVVEPGSIVGLLGRNGAGKTTLVSVIAGLLRADAGTVRVAGIDVVRDARRARACIGLAPQETGVYLPLSVRDNLRFFGGLSDLRGRVLRTRIDDVASALLLEPLLDRRARDLSGGERRRLHTAIALLHRPRLVLLDEPTTGCRRADATRAPAARDRIESRRRRGGLLDSLLAGDRGAGRRRRAHRPRPHHRPRRPP